jgi:putative nucleotidyltransferase with HDIG domain
MKHLQYRDVSISVADLEVGMNIVGLDRPWEETNFLMQGFIIRSQEEIYQLQSQCEKVFVQIRIEDTETFKRSIQSKKQERRNSNHRPGVNGPVTQQRVTYINKVSFDEAVESSRVTFDSARSMATSILDGLRFSRNINMDECRQAVEEIVDSVLANKDALRFLSQIKNKDNYTAEHSMNVCILCATFARHLGLLDFEIKTIALCGLLHDVGKSKIPLDVLNKPGRFDPGEARLMAQHTTFGRNILMSMGGAHRHAVDVAHSHHERIDGKGYPRGLSQENIPYYSKIVSIVDAYDAMTSDRVYGTPKSSEFALDILLRNKGTQFDEALVLEFVKCIGVYPAGCLVELKSGMIAIVINSNELDPASSKILVISDETKQPNPFERVVNLATEGASGFGIVKELANGSYGFDVKSYINKGLKTY